VSELQRQARGAVDLTNGRGVRLTLDGFWTPAAGLSRHGRWRPAACQFIAGEPAPSDTGKCGLPVRPGSSFCSLHHAICWFPLEKQRSHSN